MRQRIGDRKKYVLLPWLCLILRKRVGRCAQTVESVHVGRWIEEGRDILVFESRERGLRDVGRKGCHKKMEREKVPIGDGVFYSCVCLRMDIGLLGGATMSVVGIVVTFAQFGQHTRDTLMMMMRENG